LKVKNLEHFSLILGEEFKTYRGLVHASAHPSIVVREITCVMTIATAAVASSSSDMA